MSRPNMEYCMFQNTLEALRQIEESGFMLTPSDDISEEENEARLKLMKMMHDICEADDQNHSLDFDDEEYDN